MSNSQNTQRPELDKKPANPSQNIMPSSDSPYTPFYSNQAKEKQNSIKQSPEKMMDESQLNIAQASVTIESKHGTSWFRTFVIFGIIIILATYAVVAYLFYQNKSLNDVISEGLNSVKNSPTPTPKFNPDNVVIENGNIVYKIPNSPPQVLIDKNTFPSTGITGFARVVVSSDNNKLCFESIPPATNPSLYVSDIDGNNPKKVGDNKSNCLWMSNAKQIIYTGKTPNFINTNIFLYNLTEAQEVNLSADVIPGQNPNFSMVGLSSDETNLICNFVDEETTENKRCQINLSTKQFIIL